MKKSNIAPRGKWDMDIREVGCLSTTWIYGDNPCIWLKCPTFPNHLEKHRMIDRHICADNQKNIRMLNIVITSWWSIRPERLHITDHRGRHTESAVRVHVIRPEETLEQFIENVGSLCVQLSRAIKCDGIFAVLQLNFVKSVCCESNGFVPRDLTRRLTATIANHGIGEPSIMVLKNLFEMCAFWTEHTVVWSDVVVC